MNHDKHYAEKDIEPIDVIEETIERLDGKLDPRAIYHIGQSLKYLLRAGLKEGESVEKDLDKAFNYLHRAIKGEWVESAPIKEKKPPITQDEFDEIVGKYNLKKNPLGSPILGGGSLYLFYDGVYFRDKVIKSISELESIIKKELGVEEKPTFENLMDNYGLNKAENGYYTSVCGLSVCSLVTLKKTTPKMYRVYDASGLLYQLYSLDDLNSALDTYFNSNGEATLNDTN